MSDQYLMRRPEFDVIVTMGIVTAPNRLAMVERPEVDLGDYDCEDDDDHHDNHEHDDDDEEEEENRWIKQSIVD